MKNPDYNLEDLSRLSLCRNNDPMGFNCETKPLSHYLGKLMEELGEVAGAISKIERGWNPREKRKLVQKLRDKWNEKHPGMNHEFIEAPERELEKIWLQDKMMAFKEECADVFIVMDLLITRTIQTYNDTAEDLFFTQDLFNMVKYKFNKVSKELNPQTTYIV